MPSIDQIRESIAARLTEVNAEIDSLRAARTVLDGQRAAGGEADGRANGAAKSRSRRVPSAADNGDSAVSATAADDCDGAGRTAVARGAASRNAAGAPKRRRNAAAAKGAKPVGALAPGTLELMLREAADGLSASTIQKRSQASYSQVLALLRALEDGGQVQRTGTRRTTRWRLITDEERIAKRAAELERQSLTASRRAPARS